MGQLVRMGLVLVVGLGVGFVLLGPPSPRALALGAALGMAAVFIVRWYRTRGR